MASIAKFFTSRKISSPTPDVKPLKITLPRERSGTLASPEVIFGGFTASQLESGVAPISGINRELLTQIAHHQIRGFSNQTPLVKKLIAAQQEQESEDIAAYEEARAAYLANGNRIFSPDVIDGHETPASATSKALLTKAQEAQERGEVQVKKQILTAVKEAQTVDYYEFLAAKGGVLLSSPVYPAAQQFTDKQLARGGLPDSIRVIELREIIKAAQYLGDKTLEEKLTSRLDAQQAADFAAWQQVKEVHSKKQTQATIGQSGFIGDNGFTAQQLQERSAPFSQNTIELNEQRLAAQKAGDQARAGVLLTAFFKSKQHDVDLWESDRRDYFVYLSKQNGTYDQVVQDLAKKEQERTSGSAFAQVARR
jgi:hypothetical protein